MSVDRKLLDILCCPVTKMPVKMLSKEKLGKLNNAIKHGDVRCVSGNVVEDPLEEALITENGKTVYRVKSGIPVMLEEEGIPTDQVQVVATK